MSNTLKQNLVNFEGRNLNLFKVEVVDYTKSKLYVLGSSVQDVLQKLTLESIIVKSIDVVFPNTTLILNNTIEMNRTKSYGVIYIDRDEEDYLVMFSDSIDHACSSVIDKYPNAKIQAIAEEYKVDMIL